MAERVSYHDTHVLFPHFDDENLVTVERGDGLLENITRWELITEELLCLRGKLTYFKSFGVRKYNPWIKIGNCIWACNPGINCNFRILEGLFMEGDFLVDGSGATVDLMSVVIFIIDAALALPKLFDWPLLFLSGELEEVEILELSKDQVCSILANAFFCTFAHRISQGDLPRINFTYLFDDKSNRGRGWRSRLRQAKIEKLKCFFNYFYRMKEIFGKPTPNQRFDSISIVFERRNLRKERIPIWENCKDRFCRLAVDNYGKIEESWESLQVNFANKYVGGGTLGNGTAMEEIRFACCPELVAAQLFTPKLGPLEVLLVHKFIQFSSYKGYGSTFQFAGNCPYSIPFDNHVVAMDAHRFPKNDPLLQFQKRWIDRELNKCYSAFQTSKLVFEHYERVASGKWGCGVFNGHPLLKCLIQWMAASYAKKSLELYTSEDEELSSELCRLEQLIMSRSDITVGKLYSIILKYGELGSEGGQESLFQFIHDSLEASRKMTRIWKLLVFTLAMIGAYYPTLPVGIMSWLWANNNVPSYLTGIRQLWGIFGLRDYYQAGLA